MLKFDASIFGGELPVGLGVVGIAVVLPGGDFVDEGRGTAGRAWRPRSSTHAAWPTSAAFNCGRWSSAFAPLPVSTSTYSLTIWNASVSANACTALRWALIPN